MSTVNSSTPSEFNGLQKLIGFVRSWLSPITDTCHSPHFSTKYFSCFLKWSQNYFRMSTLMQTPPHKTTHCHTQIKRVFLFLVEIFFFYKENNKNENRKKKKVILNKKKVKMLFCFVFFPNGRAPQTCALPSLVQRWIPVQVQPGRNTQLLLTTQQQRLWKRCGCFRRTPSLGHSPMGGGDCPYTTTTTPPCSTPVVAWRESILYTGPPSFFASHFYFL